MPRVSRPLLAHERSRLRSGEPRSDATPSRLSGTDARTDEVMALARLQHDVSGPGTAYDTWTNKDTVGPRHGALWHACRDRLRIERFWSGFSSPLALGVESITNLKFTFKNSRPPPARPAAERVLTQGKRDALRVSKQFLAEHGFPAV